MCDSCPVVPMSMWPFQVLPSSSKTLALQHTFRVTAPELGDMGTRGGTSLLTGAGGGRQGNTPGKAKADSYSLACAALTATDPNCRIRPGEAFPPDLSQGLAYLIRHSTADSQ